MRLVRARIAVALGAALLIAVAMAAPASATPPRPWLCRDKPVFSSNQPMRYTVTNLGSRRWEMLFLQFQLDTANDGFSIVARRYLAPGASGLSGTLPAGQYYGLAMYLRGSHWICPGFVNDHDETSPGVVSSMCYGPQTACQVKLRVIPAKVSGAANPSAP